MTRIGLLTHAPISLYFRPSARDFVVQEIPLYPPSGYGEHLYVHVRKKSLSTPELLKILCSSLGIKQNLVGYAGLKDKHALSMQYITLPQQYRAKLESFTHPLIKILNIDQHHNKLRIGHLRGNRFFMRLKKLDMANATKLQSVLEILRQQGFANYFGYQRFGNNGTNYTIAQEMLAGACKIRNKAKAQFFLSALQSHFFNVWLSKRIQLSRTFAACGLNETLQLYQSLQFCVQDWTQEHPFILLKGDVMGHYPLGKLFYAHMICEESCRFLRHDIAPTGLLAGRKTMLAQDNAALFEDATQDFGQQGSRRFAWVFADEIEFEYVPQEAHGHLHFTLPKGSYASVFLEQLCNQEQVFDAPNNFAQSD